MLNRYLTEGPITKIWLLKRDKHSKTKYVETGHIALIDTDRLTDVSQCRLVYLNNCYPAMSHHPDAPRLNAHRAHSDPAFQHYCYLHQLIIGTAPKGYVTDHIHGNKMDNRRSEVRHITQGENIRNKQAIYKHAGHVHYEKEGRYEGTYTVMLSEHSSQLLANQPLGLKSIWIRNVPTQLQARMAVDYLLDMLGDENPRNRHNVDYSQMKPELKERCDQHLRKRGLMMRMAA